MNFVNLSREKTREVRPSVMGEKTRDFCSSVAGKNPRFSTIGRRKKCEIRLSGKSTKKQFSFEKRINKIGSEVSSAEMANKTALSFNI